MPLSADNSVIKFAVVFSCPFSSNLRRDDIVKNFGRRRRRSITKYKGSPVIPGVPYICLSSMRLSGMDDHCSYRLGLSQGLMRMARPFTEIRLGSPLRPFNIVFFPHTRSVFVTINAKENRMVPRMYVQA